MWIYDYKTERDNPYKEAPFLEIVHMCYIDNLPNWSYPFHVHADACELAWIMTGSGVLTLDGQTIPVEAGSVTFVPPGTLHYYNTASSDGMTYYSLRFRAVDDHSELQTFFRNLGIASANGSAYLDWVRSSMKLLFDMHNRNGGLVDESFQTIALSLIQLSRGLFVAGVRTSEADEHAYASEILNYIMEKDGKDITLESLAKHFNISPSHLSRIFCNAYHVSPINYAITARVTYATEYLLKTDLPVVKIAELVGYDNPTHFSNMFIKRIGCTPTEYRERNMKMPEPED